jgi:hypothetical protein
LKYSTRCGAAALCTVQWVGQFFHSDFYVIVVCVPICGT